MTRLVLIGVVLLGACKIRNEKSCDIPGNCREGDGGGEQPCGDSTDCAAGVCKQPGGVCVECVDELGCDVASTEPVCNSASNTCEGCTTNAQCASTACNLGTGGCFPAEQIAYVEAGGNGTCDQGSPCGSLAVAFATGRLVIKLQGSAAIVGPMRLTVDRELIVIGDAGANLSVLRTSAGPVFEVVDNGKLSLRDLEISGQTGGNAGDGVFITGSNALVTLEHVRMIGNSGHGVLANDGRKITMRGCVFSENLAGGATLNDIDLDITNSVFANNGAAGSPVGGVRLRPDNPNDTIFEFNTVANNINSAAAKAGVDCGGAFPAHNNIVHGFGNTSALDPLCTFDHSLFTGTTPNGTGNVATADIRFETFDPNDARDPKYLRIKDNSPAIDMADDSAVMVDIDGQSRPQGVARDMGADEVMQ